jgi:2'-phosphotransferase
MADRSCTENAPDGVGEAGAGAASSETTTTTTTNNHHHKKLRKLSHALSWLLRHKAQELHLPVSDDGYVPVEACLSCSDAKFSGAKWTLDDVRAVVATDDKQRFKLEMRCETDFYPPNDRKRNKKRKEAGNDEETGIDDSVDREAEVGSNDRQHRRMILCIRANQGHSIPGIDPDRLLTRLTPEELVGTAVVVHGTNVGAWEKRIRTEGLRRMKRNHIHFATGTPRKDRGGASGGHNAVVVVSGMRKSCQVYVYVDAMKCARDGIEFYRSDNGVLLTSGINGTLATEFFSHVATAAGEILMDRRPAASANDSTSSVVVGANNDS